MSKGRRGYTFQLKKGERNCPSSPFLSYSGPQELNDAPTHIGEDGSSFLSLLIQILIFSRDTLINITRNNVFPTVWISLSPDDT